MDAAAHISYLAGGSSHTTLTPSTMKPRGRLVRRVVLMHWRVAWLRSGSCAASCRSNCRYGTGLGTELG